ncbi:hypothetical protein NDU88_000329 [Pleurodeles waltl]|uniref:Uncharacterized protein n=1 Tax=Pleurodeles waltl TaxID=8319 RepID=A0AAV7SW80_PLEWA|nr:hypothetical protein NDU88_000329 [Pleurodeles waltl]
MWSTIQSFHASRDSLGCIGRFPQCLVPSRLLVKHVEYYSKLSRQHSFLGLHKKIPRVPCTIPSPGEARGVLFKLFTPAETPWKIPTVPCTIPSPGEALGVLFEAFTPAQPPWKIPTVPCTIPSPDEACGVLFNAFTPAETPWAA